MNITISKSTAHAINKAIFFTLTAVIKRGTNVMDDETV
jgi:hypothetical protein